MGFDFGIYPVAVSLYLGGYDGPAGHVAPFRHRSGWLALSEARLAMPFGTWQRPLITAISDHGEIYAPWIAARLLQLPMSQPEEAGCEPPEQLEEAMDGLYWDFLGQMDRQNLRFFEEEQERRDAEIRKFEERCSALEARLATAIRAARKERRSTQLCEAGRAESDSRLDRFLAMQDALAVAMRQRVGEMRRDTEDLERAVLSSLTRYGSVEPRLTIRWTARSHRRGMDIRLPMFQEEPYGVSTWPARAKSGMAHGSLDDELAAIRFGAQE
jgi:hypothetical protein